MTDIVTRTELNTYFVFFQNVVTVDFHNVQADGKSLFDPRVTVAGGNLTLTGVRSEDRGVYRCVASNIAATISAETELIVEESLFHRKNFGLHINSTNRNIVAYWKRPYTFCTVWLVRRGYLSLYYTDENV